MSLNFPEFIDVIWLFTFFNLLEKFIMCNDFLMLLVVNQTTKFDLVRMIDAKVLVIFDYLSDIGIMHITFRLRWFEKSAFKKVVNISDWHRLL